MACIEACRGLVTRRRAMLLAVEAELSARRARLWCVEARRASSRERRAGVVPPRGRVTTSTGSPLARACTGTVRRMPSRRLWRLRRPGVRERALEQFDRARSSCGVARSRLGRELLFGLVGGGVEAARVVHALRGEVGTGNPVCRIARTSGPSCRRRSRGNRLRSEVADEHLARAPAAAVSARTATGRTRACAATTPATGARVRRGGGPVRPVGAHARV